MRPSRIFFSQNWQKVGNCFDKEQIFFGSVWKFNIFSVYAKYVKKTVIVHKFASKVYFIQ